MFLLDNNKNDFGSELNDGVKCGNNRRLIGYVPSWISRPFTAKQAKLLTNAIYAFAEMDSNGNLKLPEGVLSQKRLNELLDAREAHVEKGLDFKVQFAVGGWANSEHFSSVLNDVDSRQFFIGEIERIIEKYNFDGVDIDWEYPITGGAVQGIQEDRVNYVTFLRELRQKLGENRLISIAAAAGTEAFTGFDVKNIVQFVDWINVMSYDFFGAWDSKWGSYVGPNAPLYHSAPPGYSGKLNVDWALRQYTCNGKQSNKIVMGVPFYGRYWSKTVDGKDPDNFPLFRMAELDDGIYGGALAYSEILDEWKIESDSAYNKFWDARSKTPWAIKNGLVLTYDNEKSIEAKVKYANEHNLAGVMIWAISQDSKDNKLLETAYKSLCHVSVGNENTYKCNPLGEEIRWWTLTEDKDKAGMCGKNAPLYKGKRFLSYAKKQKYRNDIMRVFCNMPDEFYAVCDPDDPGYSCCSASGFCGTGSNSCDCPNCIDYGKHPELLIKEPVRPSRPVEWHVGFDIAET